MTTAPVLVAGEKEQMCILSGIVDGLKELIKKTPVKKWNTAFVQAHNALDAILQERFLYFKDGGALKRLEKELDRVKIGYLEGNNDYVRGDEEAFKMRMSGDDVYSLAEMLQETKCQNCTKNKGECTLFGLYNKYNFDKYAEKPDKGVCPYSVPNERLSQAYEAEKGIKQCLLMYGERLVREAKLHPAEKEGYKAAIDNLKIITNALGSEFKLVEVE